MTTEAEVIEGQAVEITKEEAVPERALTVTAPVVQSSVIVGGIAALARMSDDTFEANITALAKVRERIDRVKLALMKEGVDYGPPFPNSTKSVLLKPGTETLLRTFGLADSYRIERHVGDGENEPDLEIIAYADIHVGDTMGPIIATGVGSANTFEVKHRYQGEASRLCPKCGMRNIIKSRPPRTGWWCGTRDGGCGASYETDDKAITDQTVGKAENVDPWDDANTITKMACKRARVDGVLTATGASGLFSQDEDARGAGGGGAPRDTGASTAPAGAPQAAGGSSGQPRQSGPSEAPGASEDVLPPGVIQAVISEKPDVGVRMVRSAATPKRWEGERAKLEVVTKVGNRKHTGILLGPLAEAAVIADLQVGEVVQFVGAVVEEITWQEGKPTKKEVWGLPEAGYLMTDLLVARDNEWRSVNLAMPTLLPPADQTPTAPEPSPSSAPASSPEPPAAAPAAAPATSSAPPSSPTTPPARMKGDADAWVALDGQLVDPIQFTVRGTTPVAVLRVADRGTGAIIFAALGKEIDEQVGTEAEPFLKPGDGVGLYGQWKGDWLVIETVGKT